MTAPTTASATSTAASFDSLDPATGDVVGRHPIDDDKTVRTAVGLARDEAAWWGSLGHRERRRHLKHWAAAILAGLPDLVDLVHRETGKTPGDATLEAGLAVDHVVWAAENAERVLRRRRVPSGLLMANQSASVGYRPLGVVGVIGPWNYPVLTPLGSVAYALAAGNAVVLKPSEHTPGVGRWLADRFEEAVGRPVLSVVTGLGPTGAALCRAGVDKIAFTGSTATGKQVMAACAETLTPVVVEAGGKDAALVDADADLPAAADAILWGACGNAGQTCIGIERVYVHEDVADAFVAELVERAVALRAGPGGDLGPMTMPGAPDAVRAHVADALARGGRAVVGGTDAVGERYVQPTILVDVPEDALAVQEETFGPTLTVTRVRDMDEAVALADGTRYGLGGAVFSRARGVELAERMRSGMASVNAVIAFAAVPALPFGGVGDSGFGRIHGPDGLREFSYAKAITRQRFAPPLALTTFERTARAERLFVRAIGLLHGRR